MAGGRALAEGPPQRTAANAPTITVAILPILPILLRFKTFGCSIGPQPCAEFFPVATRQSAPAQIENVHIRRSRTTEPGRATGGADLRRVGERQTAICGSAHLMQTYLLPEGVGSFDLVTADGAPSQSEPHPPPRPLSGLGAHHQLNSRRSESDERARTYGCRLVLDGGVDVAAVVERQTVVEIAGEAGVRRA